MFSAQRFLVASGVLLFGSLAGPSWPAAAADDPSSFTELLKAKPNDPFVKRMARLEAELRPDPRVREAEQILERLHEYSEEQLQRFQTVATENHAKAFEKWKKIEELLVIEKRVATFWPVRIASFTLTSTAASRTHRAKLKEIQAREDVAFAAYISGDPEANSPAGRHALWVRWRSTSEGESFRNEKDQSRQELRQAIEAARRTARDGTPVWNRLVQKTRTEVTHEFGVWARMIRETNEELERRRLGKEREKEVEKEQAELRLRTNASKVEEMTTGETRQIWFWVHKGRPPYRIQSYVTGAGIFTELRIDKPQPFVLPFRFLKPGRFPVGVQAADEEGDTYTVSLEIRVTGEEIKPAEEPPEPPKPPPGEKAPPVKAKPPAKPTPTKPASKPPTGSTKPTKPTTLTCRFHAKLWGPPYTYPGLPRPCLKVRSDNDHTPLIVQIDAAGHISGRAKYTLPESKLVSGATSEAHDCRIEFDLDGRFDPKTGKTTLNLRGGKRFWARKQTDGDIYEWRTEFDTTLSGWSIPGNRDAALANSPFVKSLQDSQDRYLVPRSVAGADGETRFGQDGFLGVKGLADGDLHIEHRIQRHEYASTTSRGAEVSDRTASVQQDSQRSGPFTWFLEILGPADDDDSSDRELLVAIWPRSPVRCTGNTVRLNAVGVYTDKPFDYVDVTQKATWIPNKATNVLEPVRNASGQIEKGHYRLRKSAFDEQGRPRSQYVRAGIRWGIDWAADTVMVVPTRTAKPTEQLED